MSLKIEITDENRENYEFLLSYFEGRMLTRKQVKACFENDGQTAFLTIHDVVGLLAFLFDEQRISDVRDSIKRAGISVKSKYFEGILTDLIKEKI